MALTPPKVTKSGQGCPSRPCPGAAGVTRRGGVPRQRHAGRTHSVLQPQTAVTPAAQALLLTGGHHSSMLRCQGGSLSSDSLRQLGPRPKFHVLYTGRHHCIPVQLTAPPVSSSSGRVVGSRQPGEVCGSACFTQQARPLGRVPSLQDRACLCTACAGALAQP